MSVFSLRGGESAPVCMPRAKRIEKGTAQQEALWKALTDGSGHVIAEARAGAGKSSSCREGMWRVLDRSPGIRITYTVFNAQNAREFQGDCPPGVDVGTVHALGNAALKRAFSSMVEKNKSYLILDETESGRKLQRYMRKSVASLAGHAKNQGLLPDQNDLSHWLQKLMIHFDVNAYGKPGVIVDMARDLLYRSARWVEVIDFDDMIWLPGLHDINFPACDLLFLDEVQDWNPAQRKLVRKLCPTGRVVAVGDKFQAIYAFRGADPDSIPRLQAELEPDACGLSAFPLTVTFRCPKSHVGLARQYVPDIEAHDSNGDGEVEREIGFEEGLLRARPGDMALSPTNAPLVKGALGLIAQRRKVIVRGRAIGDQLVTVYRRCANGARTIADIAYAVSKWQSQELSRLSQIEGADDLIESVQDRTAGLQAILSACQQPGEVEPAIASLFSDDHPADAVVFSTIHRAKGLEAERVWMIEAPSREPRSTWEVQQQRNLRYVGLTRSKQFLGFVDPPK